MLRGVMAAAAGLLAGVYGCRMAAALREEAATLRRFAEVTATLALLIDEQTLPLHEALRQAGSGQLLPDRLLQGAADAIERDPLLPVEEALLRSCPPGEAAAPMQRLAVRLGRGSAESRSLAARQAAEAYALLAQQADARAAKDAKLYQTLGWAGGACLSLLLM